MAPPPPPPPARRALAWLRAHAYLLFAPAGALLLFIALQNLTFFTDIENKTVDWRFQLREKHDPAADSRLILVGIDQYSLDALGRWPWPRSIHGDFLKLLSQVNPAVVGWDILFTEATNGDPASDQNLADGAAALDSVVTGALTATEKKQNVSGKALPDALTKPFPHVTGTIGKIFYNGPEANLPLPTLQKNSFFGFVDSNPGNDGIRRQMPMVVRVGDDVYPTLSTQMLMRLWKLRPQDVRVNLGTSIDFLTLDGTVSVPIDDRGQMWINYRSEKSFHEVSYGKLLGGLQYLYAHNLPWPAKNTPIEGHILLVGQTERGLVDMGPNPLQGISPLVLTHLNVLNNILTGDYLRQPKTAWIFICIGLGWLLVAYPTLWLARNTPVLVSVLLPLGIAAVYLLAINFLFARYSIVLPAAWPVLAFILIHFGAIVIRWLEEQQSKQAIKAVFGSFVSSNVMNQLLKSPENVKLGGDSKPVTIFFSDIRGFSTFAEGMTDQELITQLNEYFVRMVNRVIVNDGTLHKFIGDAVMAVWGDVLPSDLALDAKKAVRASLQMRRELTELNKLRKERGLFDFKIGMGLNHGTVVVGNIGAEGQKLEFTVIGDPVNLASRLEGVTKQFHTDLCIGESVRAFLGDDFVLRTIGLLVVKGKTLPVRAFEVIDEVGQPPTSDFDPAWVAAYEEGFNWYLERKFPEAVARFEECLAKRPGDYCCEIYLEEAKALIAEPPGPEWKGVSKLDSK